MLRYCVHSAPACVRLGQTSLRRLQCLFADTVQHTDSDSLNAVVSDLLSVTTATDVASVANSMIPFYLMTRLPLRRPELHATFLLPVRLAQSPQDCAPNKFGPSIFVALVTAAHNVLLDLDCACSSLVEVFNSIAAGINCDNLSGVVSQSRLLYSDAFAFSQLQPTRAVSAACAALGALVLFYRIMLPLPQQESSGWLSGLAERTAVERVCQYLERSNAIALLIKAVLQSTADLGFKRARDLSDSVELTVWELLVQVCKGLTGTCASDAQWL